MKVGEPRLLINDYKQLSLLQVGHLTVHRDNCLCVSAHSPPVSVKPFPAPVDDGMLILAVYFLLDWMCYIVWTVAVITAYVLLLVSRQSAFAQFVDCCWKACMMLRSLWYKYESRVRVLVYGSCKLHPYEWAFMVICTGTTQCVSADNLQVKSNRQNALRISNNIPLHR